MSDIDAAITSYQQTVEDAAKNCESLTVLKALLARDLVSLKLSEPEALFAPILLVRVYSNGRPRHAIERDQRRLAIQEWFMSEQVA
jgi:hypothetical protein